MTEFEITAVSAPLAPSVIVADMYAYNKHGEVPFSMPRGLELRAIPGDRRGVSHRRERVSLTTHI